jgi:type II secretory pathway component PulF
MTMPIVTRAMAGPRPWGYAALVVVLCGGVLAVRFWPRLRASSAGRRAQEAVLRRLPFFRGLYEAALWSNAADTLALLLRAHVPAPAALRLVGPASGTAWLERVFEHVAAESERGKGLSEAAREVADVPHAFVRALDVAEIQDDPVPALEAAAERYRSDAERRAQVFVRYLPPALALLFGVLVLIVALTVLGPYIRFWGAAW